VFADDSHSAHEAASRNRLISNRHLLYRQPTENVTEELVADHFAACVLMPKRWVRRALATEGVQTGGSPRVVVRSEPESPCAVVYEFLGLLDSARKEDER